MTKNLKGNQLAFVINSPTHKAQITCVQQLETHLIKEGLLTSPDKMYSRSLLDDYLRYWTELAPLESFDFVRDFDLVKQELLNYWDGAPGEDWVGESIHTLIDYYILPVFGEDYFGRRAVTEMRKLDLHAYEVFTFTQCIYKASVQFLADQLFRAQWTVLIQLHEGKKDFPFRGYFMPEGIREVKLDYSEETGQIIGLDSVVRALASERSERRLTLL
jgi:hypothetical protein